MSEQPASTSYLSSIVALVFGIGLAVGVSAVFGVLGWGGELASQTAGAASGAAPLILDGIRQRRARGRRQDLVALSRGRQVRPKILVASLFGFAVLLIDSAIGYGIVKATQLAIRLADGDPEKWVTANAALGVIVVLPLVLAATALLGLAAGHRLGSTANAGSSLGWASTAWCGSRSSSWSSHRPVTAVACSSPAASWSSRC